MHKQRNRKRFISLILRRANSVQVIWLLLSFIGRIRPRVLFREIFQAQTGT
jgi:hypothetical protein